MSIGVAVEVSAAGFQQVARHFNVVMFEVMKQHFETVQCFYFGVQAKLDKLSYESHHFDLQHTSFVRR